MSCGQKNIIRLLECLPEARLQRVSDLAGARLEPAPTFKLPGNYTYYTGNPQISLFTNGQFKWLREFAPKLVSLHFSGVGWPEMAADALSPIVQSSTRLTELTVSAVFPGQGLSAAIITEKLTYLFLDSDRMAQFEVLSLYGTISEPLLTLICVESRKLTSFSLQGCIDFEDYQLEGLVSSSPGLVDLKIVGCLNITDAALITVANTIGYRLRSFHFDKYDARKVTGRAWSSIVEACRNVNQISLPRRYHAIMKKKAVNKKLRLDTATRL